MTDRHFPPFLIPAFRQMMLLGGVACCAATASASNDLALQLETSLLTDSNPFRFYDHQTDARRLEIQRLTEVINAADVRGGAIIPLFSEQTRLILAGSLGNRHYKDYRQLDHQQAAGDAVLEWHAGKVLDGRVTAGKDKRLFQYINGTLTERDLAHQTTGSADINLKISDEWQLRSRWFRSELAYDLPVNQLYNFTERGQQAGALYLSPTGSSIGAGVRHSDVYYPDRTPQQIADLDRHYQENEFFLDAEWQYSVKTATSAHLGMIRRRYTVLDERNSNLFNAIWRGVYRYSPKLRLDMQLYNRPFSIVDPAVLYVTSKGVRFDALWHWSDKTRFNFSTLWQTSDQQLIPRLTLPGNTSRKENLQRIGVGASYQLERGFRVFFDSFYEKTTRKADDQQLKQAVMKLGLEYTFENLPGSATKVGLLRYQQSLSASDPIRE
ncbi:hypothetical protein [Undibacterium oligocarboniphilum]|uniref:Uncharacterized protein n=1 Tax=Undibacterium oligocarboniphilum TaxID=666702 RepID=A0A850QIQ3_9BURK|nr:hypothetical protein [Undibacterium oligocarboniphilum]MBC3868670.1 hypothetical protein [Undibacterium oligocarboniphilum]NVO76650.1 hypothetical protein [Undibacterium oligocarboniphilum]